MTSNPVDKWENSLSRLGEARDFATKEANRFLLIGLGFTLLYGAKISGYHLDEVIINRDVASLHNGAFLYLVVAQVSMVLCMLRGSDSVAIENSMKDILKIDLVDKEKDITELFPNTKEWFGPVSSKMKRIPRGGFWRILFNVTSAFTMVLGLCFYLLPVLAGFYYIGDPLAIHFSSQPDVELTVVVITTTLCFLWILNAIGVATLLARLHREEGAS